MREAYLRSQFQTAFYSYMVVIPFWRQIADPSSTNAVSFSAARTTKRFPSRCASAIQIVLRWSTRAMQDGVDLALLHFL
jgi:hypothetical protein